jgi:hypothetical protein
MLLKFHCFKLRFAYNNFLITFIKPALLVRQEPSLNDISPSNTLRSGKDAVLVVKN